MRIVIDGRLILNHMTGIGRYLHGLISGFLELETLPELILYVQPSLHTDNPIRHLNRMNPRLVDIPIRHMSLRQHMAMKRYLLNEMPDIYHYPHFDLPWLNATPSVVTLHDLTHLAYPQFFSDLNKLKQIYMRLVTPYSLSKAKGVIVVSDYTRWEIKRLFPSLRVAPWTVHLGVDKRYQPLSATKIQFVKDKYTLPGDYILFVSERRPHKNIIGLIEAYHQLKRADIKLVIVGRPYSDYREPEQTVNRLGLSDRVLFLSNVGDDDLHALYNGARIFVLPSFFEGFGLPVLEAMACGAPVITSNQSALPEIAGEAALLINPNDKTELAESMGRLLEDRQLCQDLTEKGFAQAAKFTWQETARQTLMVYQRVFDLQN